MLSLAGQVKNKTAKNFVNKLFYYFLINSQYIVLPIAKTTAILF